MSDQSIVGGPTPGSGWERSAGRGPRIDTAGLTSIEDQIAWLVDATAVTPAAAVPLERALGLVVAAAHVSRGDVPSFRNAAMDGYAVRAQDLSAASPDRPVRLPLLGDIPAGRPPELAVRSGTAVRIMTGAPAPDGADTVVPVELATEDDGEVVLTGPWPRAKHLRDAGEDVTVGEEVAAPGDLVTPSLVGLLSSCGVTQLTCYRRPVVSVVPTGDELVPAGTEPGPGHIRNSNGPLLGSLLRQAGAEVRCSPAVPDDLGALTAALLRAADGSDLIITTGGASAGRSDLLVPALAAAGTAEAVQVAMRPGTPQVRGRVAGTPVLGLPGNPAAVLICFEVVVRPVVRHLQGHRDPAPARVRAVAGAPLPGTPHKVSFVRVRFASEGTCRVVHPLSRQGSHILSSAVAADGLARVPPTERELPPGTEVDVQPFDPAVSNVH